MTPGDLVNLAHLRRARDLIDRDYAQPLDVPALARAAFMSPSHFSRRFRAIYGETPYSYLMTRRIERAKALLRRGDLSVTEVCVAVGCTSLGSFSARFTQLVGVSPSFYRDVLELDVHTDATMDDFRWVTLSPKSQPDLEIGLMNPHMGPGAPDADAVLTLTAKGSMNGLIFATTDVDADFEKVRAAGAEVLQEPISQPYGVRDCAFRDPSGKMIRLSQSS